MKADLGCWNGSTIPAQRLILRLSRAIHKCSAEIVAETGSNSQDQPICLGWYDGLCVKLGRVFVYLSN